MYCKNVSKYIQVICNYTERNINMCVRFAVYVYNFNNMLLVFWVFICFGLIVDILWVSVS